MITKKISSSNKKFFVRAEITGDFVTKESFDKIEDAIKYYNERVFDCIYDKVDIWEA